MARVRVFIQLLVQAYGTHRTLDHLELPLLARDVVERGIPVHATLNAVGFTNAGRATHDHALDLLLGHGLCHFCEDVESTFDTRYSLLV